MKAILVDENNKYLKRLEPIPVHLDQEEKMRDHLRFAIDSFEGIKGPGNYPVDKKFHTQVVPIGWFCEGGQKERALYFSDESIHLKVLSQFGSQN